VVAAEFAASARVRSAEEANKRDDLRALALAEAGYRLAVAALDRRLTGIALDDDGVLVLSPDDVKGAGKFELADGAGEWSIRGENGLVNVNTAARPLLVKVLEQCGMGPGAERDTVADSILDWVDTNREHRINGAEEDYYRGLDPPYSCKDGPLDTIEELLLVRGVTKELFAGGATVAGKARPGLRELLGKHGGTTPTACTAPDGVLEALNVPRPTNPCPVPSPGYFVIVATGRPAGTRVQRSLRAVVRRAEQGSRGDFSLLYWNDDYLSPTTTTERSGR
jgi:hypothetical protein